MNYITLNLSKYFNYKHILFLIILYLIYSKKLFCGIITKSSKGDINYPVKKTSRFTHCICLSPVFI